MKSFIVFLAFVLLFVSFTAFTSDMQNYANLQRFMKYCADECAAAAALMTDGSDRNGENVVIDEANAQKAAAKAAEIFTASEPPLSYGTLDAITEVIGDDSVKVTLIYHCCEGRHLFRLPFLSKTSVSVCSVYEWK